MSLSLFLSVSVSSRAGSHPARLRSSLPSFPRGREGRFLATDSDFAFSRERREHEKRSRTAGHRSTCARDVSAIERETDRQIDERRKRIVTTNWPASRSFFLTILPSGLHFRMLSLFERTNEPSRAAKAHDRCQRDGQTEKLTMDPVPRAVSKLEENSMTLDPRSRSRITRPKVRNPPPPAPGGCAERPRERSLPRLRTFPQNHHAQERKRERDEERSAHAARLDSSS